MDRNQNDTNNQNTDSVSNEKTNTDLYETAVRVEDPSKKSKNNMPSNSNNENPKIVNEDEDEFEDDDDFEDDIDNEEEDGNEVEDEIEDDDDEDMDENDDDEK